MNYTEIEIEWMKEILREKEEEIKKLEEENRELKRENDLHEKELIYLRARVKRLENILELEYWRIVDWWML